VISGTSVERFSRAGCAGDIRAADGREALFPHKGDMTGRGSSCAAGLPRESAHDDEPFPVRSRIAHKTFGKGMVVRYHGGCVTILFEEGGEKTIDMAIARARAAEPCVATAVRVSCRMPCRGRSQEDRMHFV
jgi:hypothetical protein